MRLEDEQNLELRRLRSRVAFLEREVERLELELEQERLGLTPSFFVPENQLSLSL
jgi:hypothetical protein